MSIGLILAFLSYDQYWELHLSAQDSEDGSLLSWSLRILLVSRTHPLPTAAREPERRNSRRASGDRPKWEQTEGEGPRSERHGPAPRTQLWALCFCFPSPLCCQKVPWRAAGPEVLRRQSGSCKVDSFSRWVRREGKEMHVWCGEKRRLGLRLIPVRTVLLGRHGQESRSQGPGCCPMRELIPHPILPSSVGQGRGLVGRQLGTRRGTVPGSNRPPTPPPPPPILQKWAATLPSLALPADARPYCPGVLSMRLLKGKTGGLAQGQLAHFALTTGEK